MKGVYRAVYKRAAYIFGVILSSWKSCSAHEWIIIILLPSVCLWLCGLIRCHVVHRHTCDCDAVFSSELYIPVMNWISMWAWMCNSLLIKHNPLVEFYFSLPQSQMSATYFFIFAHHSLPGSFIYLSSLLSLPGDNGHFIEVHVAWDKIVFLGFWEMVCKTLITDIGSHFVSAHSLCWLLSLNDP